MNSTASKLSVALGFEAASSPNTGIGRYTQDLYDSLAQHPEIAEVRRFANFSWITDKSLDEMDVRSPTAESDAPSPRRWLDRANLLAQRVVGGEALRRKVRDVVSRRFLDIANVDLYHEPNHVPRATRLPTVATVHDLGAFLHPEFCPPGRIKYLTAELPKAVQRVDHIIAISTLARNDIVVTLGVQPAKISVVQIGLNPHFHERPEADCRAQLTYLGLAWKGYTLFVGTLEPRKNLDGALNALRLLPTALAKRFPLVVVGGGGWLNDDLLASLEKAVRDGIAIHLSHIDIAMLATLYAGARGLVFVSHYEGQGLPAIEAAASGVPVLTSSGSAMEEQLGALGTYAQPRDCDGIAQGIRSLIEDDDLAHRARAAAAEIRARFSMETCASATVAVYRKTLAGGRMPR
jgi:glycosyltransferase involved in cell wall biosynthesis